MEKGWTPTEKDGFRLGERVVVNATMPYPDYHGRQGVVEKFPVHLSAEWIGVRLDGEKYVFEWHRDYFDHAQAADGQ